MTYSRGGNGGFNRGGRDFDRPAMFDAVCAKCGDRCQVPFKPNGSKDVYCSKCFETVDKGSNFQRQERNSFSNFRDSRDSRGGFRSEEKQMFQAICDQCGDHCQVPFEPRNGKPVLCSSCFGGERNSRPRFESSNKESVDFSAINAKLDKIIELLSARKDSKPKSAEKIEKEDMSAKIMEEISENASMSLVKEDKKVKTKKKAVKK